MKFIWAKFYYNIYDIGNGRVRKLLTTYEFKAQRVLEWGNAGGSTISDITDKNNFEQKCKDSLLNSKKVLDVIPLEYFGNPSFINELEYEQDMASIRDELFAMDDTAFIQFVKDYIAFQHLLWSHGFSDTVYNFTVNCGISKNTGKFICTDFSEFTAFPEKVLADIETKKWLTQKTLRDFPANRTSLKETILALFDSEFTKEKFEEFWK